MKAIKHLNRKSTFFVLLCAIFYIQVASASDLKEFPQLPSGFDNEFRFNNRFGVKGKVAFSAKIKNFQRILVLDLDNRRIYKLIDGPGNNSYPNWSPKGDKIVFTSERDGNMEIYLASADGSQQERLTKNNRMDDNANWMPDGKSIVYLSEMPEPSRNLHTNIYILDLETKKRRQITNFSGKNSTPDASKDGKLIAYTTNRYWPGWDVCIYDLEKRKEYCPLSGTSTYCRPAWSPDGKTIAYSAGLLSTVNGYLLDVDTQKKHDLTKTDGSDYDLTWSADGEYIIFTSDHEKKDIYNIYITKVNDNPDHEIYPLLTAPYSMRYLSWFEEQKESNNDES